MMKERTESGAREYEDEKGMKKGSELLSSVESPSGLVKRLNERS
jgi:hypothetical protein